MVRVDFGESSFLFTGDLETHAVELLVDYYWDSETLDVDIYQVGHHGSHNGTTLKLLAAVSPDMAVLSVGDWDFGQNSRSPFTTWRYGHPRSSF